MIGLALPGYAIYAATKAAIETMTNILAKELRGKNITVNAVAPGPTATALVSSTARQSRRRGRRPGWPAGRWLAARGQPHWWRCCRPRWRVDQRPDARQRRHRLNTRPAHGHEGVIPKTFQQLKPATLRWRRGQGARHWAPSTLTSWSLSRCSVAGTVLALPPPWRPALAPYMGPGDRAISSAPTADRELPPAAMPT